jgi:hypothetical protein
MNTTNYQLFLLLSYARHLEFLFLATTSSPIPSVPIQSSAPIVPARVLKGKKFKRGGRVTSRA